MNSQEVLSVYENIAELMTQMLAAARSGDWKQLAALESRCSSQVEILKSEESRIELPEIARERKVKIIRKILEDDREIRSITEPWMAQLSALMNNAGTERKLSEAYGVNRSG